MQSREAAKKIGVAEGGDGLAKVGGEREKWEGKGGREGRRGGGGGGGGGAEGWEGVVDLQV